MSEVLVSTPIQLWIDALENRYWRITGRLRGSINDSQICVDGFCHLGVLCDLYIKHAPKAKEMKARWESWTFVWEEDGQRKEEKEFLPAPVRAWWQLYHNLDLGGIVEFSDHRGCSFNELALYLRGLERMHYLSPK